ncbi:MAG TPA: response regulator transcription factor [Actinomycetota bacterium]
MQQLSVLVVGDACGVASALTVACRRDRHLLVLGPVPDAASAAEALPVAPDLFVVDLDRADELGVDVLARLRELVPFAKVLATTVRAGAEVASEVVSHGGAGLLPQPFVAAEVRDAIQRALAGELILPADDLAAVLSGLERARWRSAERVLLSTLTTREQQVLGLLAEGRGTVDIAAALGISGFTVQSHVKNILAKLGVHSKVEAVRMAWRCRAVAVPA